MYNLIYILLYINSALKKYCFILFYGIVVLYIINTLVFIFKTVRPAIANDFDISRL
jgi:hypothetical protein